MHRAALLTVVLVSLPASTDGVPNPLTPDDAVAIAVNDLVTTAGGFSLRHPLHTAEFDAEGITFRPAAGGATWRWELSAIRTGDARVPARPVSPVQSAPDRIEFARAGVTERYLLRARTIEQQFVLEAPLSGSEDDLVIEGHVASDGVFTSETGGWSWSQGEARVFLGDVTVFDARGRELAARMSVTSDRTRIVVDGGDLARAMYPVTVDPEIGANDFRISDMGPDVAGRAAHPAVAYSPLHNEYLIVWDGYHKMPHEFTRHSDVFGQFVDASSGIKIGTEALLISETAPNNDSTFTGAGAPDVVYNANEDEYLVVWSSDDDGGGMVAGESEIFAQRIAGATHAEIGADLRISDMGPNGDPFGYWAGGPTVAHDSFSNTYLVVWSGTETFFEEEIYGQRLDGSAGAEIGANDFRLSDMGPDGSSDYWARVAQVVFNPVVNEFLVAWIGDDNSLGTNETEVWVQRVNAATGAQVGVNDLRVTEVSNGVPLGQAFGPSIAYNGNDNEYLVVFQGHTPIDQIHVQRLNGTTAAQIGPNDFPISGAVWAETQNLPSVCFNAATSEYLVTWRSQVTGPFETTGQRLSAAGVEIGPDDFLVSQSPPGPFEVGSNDVIHAGGINEYLSVWCLGGIETMNENGEEIYGQRLTAAGTEIGTDQRITGMGENCFDAFDPAVAYNPIHREYLVVWSGDDGVDPLVDGEFEIYGQLIDAETGAEKGVNDARISMTGIDGDAEADALDPAVAFNPEGITYLVVWAADPGTGGLVAGESEIFGRLVEAETGAPAGGPDLRFSDMGPDGTTLYAALTPAVAASSDGYQIVWRGDDDTVGNNEFEIFGQRVGLLGGEVGGDVRLSDMGPEGNSQYHAINTPALAYSPSHDEFLVVWSGDDGTPPMVNDEHEIFGQRINATTGLEVGTNDVRLSDMGPDGVSLYTASNPAVAYNETNDEYLVAWAGEDNTGGLVEGKNQIFGQRIRGASGAEVGANDFRISHSGAANDDALDAFSPGVAWDPDANQYLVVWDGEDDTPPHVDTETEIFAQILDGATAAEVGEDFALSDMGPPSHVDYDAFWPAIASAPGLGFLVVWEGDDSGNDLFDGESEIFGQLYEVNSATGAAVLSAASSSADWLGAVSPNPSRGTFQFSVEVREGTRMRARLVNVQGRVVATLVDQAAEAGARTFAVDLPSGVPLANGVYFLQVEAGDRRQTRKVVLVR